MSCLQNEGKLNNEKLTVIERERKKIVFKYQTPFTFGITGENLNK